MSLSTPNLEPWVRRALELSLEAYWSVCPPPAGTQPQAGGISWALSQCIRPASLASSPPSLLAVCVSGKGKWLHPSLVLVRHSGGKSWTHCPSFLPPGPRPPFPVPPCHTHQSQQPPARSSLPFSPFPPCPTPRPKAAFYSGLAESLPCSSAPWGSPFPRHNVSCSSVNRGLISCSPRVLFPRPPATRDSFTGLFPTSRPFLQLFPFSAMSSLQTPSSPG